MCWTLSPVAMDLWLGVSTKPETVRVLMEHQLWPVAATEALSQRSCLKSFFFTRCCFSLPFYPIVSPLRIHRCVLREIFLQQAYHGRAPMRASSGLAQAHNKTTLGVTRRVLHPDGVTLLLRPRGGSNSQSITLPCSMDHAAPMSLPRASGSMLIACIVGELHVIQKSGL